MQPMETIHRRHRVAGMLFLTALINKWGKKAPPVHSKAQHKDQRNRGALPSRNSLDAHRVMEHLATVRLRTTDNLTAEDAIMAAVAAAHHGVAAAARALAGHGIAVVVVAVAAKCHGIVVAVAAKCHGTADVADAACHGAAKKGVAALWIKTASQIPGMTC